MFFFKKFTTTPKSKDTIEALWRLEKIILDTLDFKEVVQKIVDSMLLELGYLKLGYRIVVLTLVDEKEGMLKRISISQTAEAQRALEVTPVPFHEIEIPVNDIKNMCIRAIQEKSPFITHDWIDILHPSYSEEDARYVQKVVGIKTSMVYPVISRDKAIGALIFSMIKDEKEVSEAEKDLIKGFTDIVGLAVQNAQLYSSLEQRNKTISLLRKIDEIILSSVTDIRQITQQVTNLLTSETDFIKAAVVLTLDKAGQILTRIALSESESIHKAEIAAGKAFHELQTPLTSEQNLVTQVVKEKKMLVTNSLYNVLVPHFTQEESQKIQEAANVKSSLIYPLIVRDKVIGAVIISIGENEAGLSEYQRDLLNRLVNLIGIAIDNALLYQEIQEANEKLKALDKLKDEFISLAAHELRTPMTAVKSYLWMILNRGPTLDEVKKKLYMDRIYHSTERLLALVNDMLDVSRIESGRLVLKPAAMTLIDLSHEVADEFAAKVSERKQTLSVVDSAIPQVFADRDKIDEVLLNLVGNAVKYTPEGGNITISFKENAGMIETSVSDTGKGISQEDLGRLFQKFGRLDNRLVSVGEAGGTGLGLYICKQLVELSGGKIWATSPARNAFSIADAGGEVGCGSTFTFSLPVFAGQTIAVSSQT